VRGGLGRDLRDDLGLDEGAIPVVLSLVDQLYGMRRELRALARAVEQQPPDVAAHVRAAYRALTDA
jgi:chaperone modulatory protein CbpM